MSFTINTVDISTNAPSLAPLAGREYTSEYTSLPNANLPKGMRKDLDTVFQYLTTEELPLDENTFLIKSVIAFISASSALFSKLAQKALKALKKANSMFSGALDSFLSKLERAVSKPQTDARLKLSLAPIISLDEERMRRSSWR